MTREECEGKPSANFWADPKAREDMVKTLRAQGHVDNLEFKLIKKGGEILTCITSLRLYPEIGILEGSITDITERKRVEDALAAEKERLLVTLRSIEDAVIATDVSGRIVLMNKVAEMLTGWTLSEAQSKPLGEVFVIINELTRKPCDNPVDKVLSTGAIVNLENHTVLVGKTGAEYVIADSGAPIKDRDSKTIGVVLVFRDNTEKQKNQEALQKAQQLESIGVLAGGIAHDFNNLLSGLFGYLDLARESINRGEEAGQYIEKAFSVFGRAKDLTGQLLTFSKGGAPARKIAPLAPLVRDAVHFALSGSSIKCRFTIAPDLWPASFDENQIGQVMDNIVINARDAMPMGGTITVIAENIPEGSPLPAELVKSNYVRIRVSDLGTGISPEHLPRIFDPFFTTKQKGSGLGLATAYSIVKRHDGVITAQSELGKGATICIFLPASNSAADFAIAPVSAPHAHKGRGAVLVMDDEDFIRDIAADMLASMGYTVETALHGAQAVSLFATKQKELRPFDLVILDLTIPGGMGGRQTKDELRKLAPNVKIIASSGYSDDPIMSKPQEHGFDAAVRKPYDKAELAKAVSIVMDEEKS
jgi:PAS domain S-box-containing protein